MMKEEFISHINALGNPTKYEDLPDDEYQIIEYVYNYHPAIDDKNDIARLYCLRGGFHIICDMKPTAEYWEAKEKEMQTLRKQISEAQDKLNKILSERRFVAEH